MKRLAALLVGVSLMVLASLSNATSNHITLNVPSQYPTITAAVRVANADANLNNYYVVNVQAGTYTNDFPTVDRPMTIQRELTQTGYAVMQATVPLPNQKGIILNHANLTVIGIKFTGAEIDNSLGGNGAGIRDQNNNPNAHLIIISSDFENNQEGILTGANPTQAVQISWSKFKNNGNPNESFFQHGVYVGAAKSLYVDHSIFCGQLIGHEIKSRAANTTVTASHIYDGADDAPDGCTAGSSSYAIDTPNGGTVAISNNTIVQGATSQNSKIIGYGEEGMVYPTNSINLSFNTITSSGLNATGVYIPNCPVKVQGLSTNTFTGIQTIVNPAGCSS